MSRQRRRYDDKFRASAVIMLEAAGYPDEKGALTRVANHIGVPVSTLRGWFLEKNNPPPTELRTEKRGDLVDWIKEELGGIFEEMPKTRQEATFRDLGVVAGILMDKLQLLQGKPTEIIEDASLTDLDRSQRIAAILDAARERRDRQIDSNGRDTAIIH